MGSQPVAGKIEEMIHTATLWDCSPDEVRARLHALDLPAFRATQALHHAYARLATSYDEMTDLPASLRQLLARELPAGAPEVAASRRSADGSTEKALLRLHDGNTVEAVLMEYDPSDAGRGRRTVCISSQVGCAMGCVFCATGQQGFLRNLTPGEIVQQVLHFARVLQERGERVTNVVFMGMGEPLANYEATLKAVRILTSPDAFGLGARHITVSTVGLGPMIRRLADEHLQVGLAVSLHSADDELRRRLVPTARQSIDEILAAADYFAATTGRRYSVEYALIDRRNDTPELAAELVARLCGRRCHVNLIPLNPTANGETRRSGRHRVIAFQRVLQDAAITTTVRVEKGVDIAAGCGQLRGEVEGPRVKTGTEPLPVLDRR
jgi:23S rRNA (adenine2503-C2)-methyltransferase